MFKIEGILVATPASLGWGVMNLDSEDSGRTLDGKMHIDPVAIKEKLEPVWNGLDSSETSKILKLVVNKRIIEITYPSPLEGMVVTKRFYTGDKTTAFYSWTDNNKTFSALNFNLVEE